MLSFSRRYFLLAFILFIIEVLIALFVRDRFFRPYFGDYLVVILIYCSLRAIIKANPIKLAIGVLLFAYTVELLQYFRILDRLGLSGNELARTVIGHGFEWWDLLAYTLGIITVLTFERYIAQETTLNNNNDEKHF
ncbi:DUF2809 domain-containing protein [Flavihumibacter solisilvae]|uniref:ribosomal maturation YjgA family protein n=1 Tax=Flavihumibacter solisilvae TaxID=1349421 RepID=UPI00068AB041|nr:DUF2809 domain-containing protein [Flavihumibacter solisilvae]